MSLVLLSDLAEEDIRRLLSSDDLSEHIRILLQMAELNLVADIEGLLEEAHCEQEEQEKEEKEKEKEKEADDDLLSDPKPIEEPKEKDPKKEQRELLGAVREVLRSIAERPMDFIGEDAAAKVNRKLRRNLLPTRKEDLTKRSRAVLQALMARVKRKEKSPSFDF